MREAAAGLTGVDQYAVLIQQYLGQRPADDLAAFVAQAAAALWAEERFFKNMAMALGGK